MMAWRKCQVASWSWAAKDYLGVVRAFDKAVRYLGASALSMEGGRAWRPIVLLPGRPEKAPEGKPTA